MDVRIISQADMVAPEMLPTESGEVAFLSARSPAKTTANEDCAVVIPTPGGVVLAVADGLGGMRAGEAASSRVVEDIAACVQTAVTEGGEIRAAILNGLETANQTIVEMAIGAATTVVVAEVQGETVRPYHVGDSVILLVGQRGRIKFQSISHSPVGYAVESGLLDEAEAMHHHDRHLVSNIIGSPSMRIEIGPTLPFAEHDTLLLASDGLADNLHTQEIIDSIKSGPLERAVERLAEWSRRRMLTPEAGQPSHPDDLTFIVYRRRKVAVTA